MRKIIILIMSLILVLSGCSTTDTSGEIEEIRFKDMIEVNELKKLNGKEIKMIGFMAQSSPLDGSMIYLMNLPYQNCVYCIPNTNQLMNTMAVYPEANKTIEFTDVPVEIVGTLKFENITDEMGYSYQYRIVNATVKTADGEDMDESLKVFTDLVNRGFAGKVSEILSEANRIIYAEENGTSLSVIQLISEELLVELDRMFTGLDESKYIDILELVDELKTLVFDINETLKSGKYSEMEKFIDKDYDLFYKIYEWLVKAEV